MNRRIVLRLRCLPSSGAGGKMLVPIAAAAAQPGN